MHIPLRVIVVWSSSKPESPVTVVIEGKECLAVYGDHQELARLHPEIFHSADHSYQTEELSLVGLRNLTLKHAFNHLVVYLSDQPSQMCAAADLVTYVEGHGENSL